jgi:hypothetical protein
VGLLAATAWAHDGLDLPPPESAPEAWNVLQACAVNIDLLIAWQQWSEIPVQLALMGQSARFFRERALDSEVAARWQALENQGIFTIRAALEKRGPETADLYTQYRALLAALEKDADPKVTQAKVYSCPVCRGIRELDASVGCVKCGQALVPRIIPASSLYHVPGAPSMVLTPRLDRPLTPGQPGTLTFRLTRQTDGAPVTPDELLIKDTERIHLLAIDESLADFHRVHPQPSGAPGEYAATLTPRRPGPYRLFADLTPRLSSVQEYVVADLPAADAGLPLEKSLATQVSAAGPLRLELAWQTGGLPLRARQPIGATLAVFGPDGQPFTQLEPLLGGYVQLTAFHEDRRTVLHLHAGGPLPQTPEDRAGPRFPFRFWAPQPGYYRLFVEVQAGGKKLTAPFAVPIDP